MTGAQLLQRDAELWAAWMDSTPCTPEDYETESAVFAFRKANREALREAMAGATDLRDLLA